MHPRLTGSVTAVLLWPLVLFTIAEIPKLPLSLEIQLPSNASVTCFLQNAILRWFTLALNGQEILVGLSVFWPSTLPNATRFPTVERFNQPFIVCMQIVPIVC